MTYEWKRAASARIGTALAGAALACAALAGCDRTEPGATSEAPPAVEPGDAIAGDDVAVANTLLDRGDVPAAIAPLERALAAPIEPRGMRREDVELLLGQLRAATSDQALEAEIGRLRDAPFEEYVENGRLPSVPYFDDPRVDAYFRKRLLEKRAEAREIRTRVRGSR